jgi:DNA-binding beta-propeller fold protein YncE
MCGTFAACYNYQFKESNVTNPPNYSLFSRLSNRTACIGLTLAFVACLASNASVAQTLVQTIDLTHSPVPVVSICCQTTPPVIPGGPQVWLSSVAVNPVTNTVYVGDYVSSNVYTIDGANNTVTAAVLTNNLRTTIDIGVFVWDAPGMGPAALMVDPLTNRYGYLGAGGGAWFNGTAYVEPLNNESTLSGAVWDPLTNNIYAAQPGQFLVTKNLKFIGGGYACAGSTNAVALNVMTSRVYVSCGINVTGSVIAYDGLLFKDKRITNPPLATLTSGRQAAGLAVNPNTNRVYVVGKTSPTSLDVIDGSNYQLLASIPGLASPAPPTPQGSPYSRPVAINSVTNTIFVVNTGASSVAVIDGSTNTLTNTFSTPDGAVAVAVNENTNTLYVANFGGTVGVYALDPPVSAPRFSINGVIMDAKGVPAAGVTVNAFGPAGNDSAVTDARGLYVITGLPVGIYTVTPSSANLLFTPFSRSVQISNSNLGAVSFVPGAAGGAGTTYKISIAKNGKGSVTTNPSAASYARGTVVSLTATPDPGSPWIGWAGACSGTATTCTVTMNADLSVTANFR